MAIHIVRLVVTGQGKPLAAVEFLPGANLILGPSDTGKSYVVGCIKFALGSDTTPKQIPYASGYDRLALQFLTAEDVPYTVFRSMSGGETLFYEGHHDSPPLAKAALKTRDVNEFLITLLGLQNNKVLLSQEKKGKVTAGDLRHYSIFTEGDTLSEHSYLGANVTNHTRRRSALYLMMTGVDDTAIALGADKTERLTTKGHIIALEESIKSYQAELTDQFIVEEVKSAIERIDGQLKENENILRENRSELNEIRSQLSEVGINLVRADTLKVAAIETLDRFDLLDNKYGNDLERLHLIRSAASVFDEFAPQPCALCNTPIIQQNRAIEGTLPSTAQMSEAADGEYRKIEALRIGLGAAIADVRQELSSIEELYTALFSKQTDLARRQALILSPFQDRLSFNITGLTQRRDEYLTQIRAYEKIEELTAKRNSIEPRTKKLKIEIKRNATSELSILIERVKKLLESWGLDESRQVGFDESACDLRLLEAPRLSYGKGKRAIFLAAYSIALMERALSDRKPHLGFVVIDSPLLTYRDPKCLSADDAISETVADRFFDWMANWNGPGQLVVLENTEPKAESLTEIPHIIFVGPNIDGRRGFYP